ncbi:MAG TPA: prepilin-type N-terminal cleavage/methylation domain-containing protein [Bacilli bacterium]
MYGKLVKQTKAARKMPQSPGNEHGLTVIELLTALLLLGMVASILYSFLLMGLSMYKRVTVETQMRNQGDALFSRIITELKDTIYVKQGSSDKEIVYVKRAVNSDGSPDTENYVAKYAMAIENVDNPAILSVPYGISIYHVNPDGTRGALLKKLALTNDFTIDRTASSLLMISQDMVEVKLEYGRTDSLTALAAESPDLTIDMKIPLFRID